MAEMQFTPQQLRAIEDRGGAVLVSAAAGSGKTRVLVERLMRRLLDPADPCEIDEFLIITFTKKAAAELRARIAKELSDRMADNPNDRRLRRQLSRLNLARITTIDGFCSELVRANAFELDISPEFRQIEGEQAQALRDEVIASLLESQYESQSEAVEFLHLADTLGAGRGDGELERAIGQVYDSAQCHLFPDAWLERCIRALDLSQYADAGQTPWGSRLIEDFGRFCLGKRQLLQGALERCAAEPAVQARYGPVLAQEIEQLDTLSRLDRWDALHAAAPVFQTMPSFKKAEKTDLQEQTKKLRDSCKASLLKKLAEFASDSETVMAELAQTSRALIMLFQLVRAFDRAYTREKRRLRVQDFADLEHGAVRLLLYDDGRPRPLAKELSERFREIMLDEYQDTNEVQDRLFAAISRDGKNRFMVGDVKQAIYRFRLADPGIFLDKYERYADAETAAPGEPRKILLSHNFRSGPGILDAVNAVFSACMSKDVGDLDYGEAEMLRQGKPRPKLNGPVTELHVINTKPLGSEGAAPDKDAVEAAFVARRIASLLREGADVCDGEHTRPVRPEDIVILLRSVANTAQTYANALRAQGIACQSDREQQLLDAPEIETLVSLLRVIDNPRQDIPLTAALLSPVVGMTADTLAAIRAAHRGGDLFSALEASAHPQAKQFLETLRALRASACESELSALLTELGECFGLEELLSALPDAETRLQNLHGFYALADSFSEGGSRSLPQFLASLDTVRQEQRGAQAVGGAVRLMSIHKSKGLEFPVVVLAGLSRKFNEQEYQQQVLLHPQLGAGCNVYDANGRYRYHSIAKRAIISKLRAESRAEELRVLYVAMTRAQDRLIMTYCGGAADGRLKTLAQRLTLPPEPLLAAEAGCPGDWILETALLRSEADALFAAGGYPMERAVSEIPWNITYQEVSDLPQSVCEAAPDARQPTETADEQALLDALAFRYPHSAAETLPAKVTATQLKGRSLDEEVSDNGTAVEHGPSERGDESVLHPAMQTPHFAQNHRISPLRQPLFLAQKPLSPAERGTAAHLAMQYLDFTKTDNIPMLAAELRRLVDEEYLTEKQAAAVSPEQLLRIFTGPVGQRIKSADSVIREFKFSILTDASIYDPAGTGEQLLLQGVTDCCLIREGKLTVIDFKTDRVTKGGEPKRAERYRGQLEAYSLALSRIFRMPVAERILYFFQTDTEVLL